MIHARLRKMDEIKDSVAQSRVSYSMDACSERSNWSRLIVFMCKFTCFHHFNQQQISKAEIQRSAQVCDMLINAIQRQQAELVEELEERQQECERRAAELYEELQREVSELQTRNSVLQNLEQAQNPVHLVRVSYSNCISTFLCRVNISRRVLMRNLCVLS